MRTHDWKLARIAAAFAAILILFAAPACSKNSEEAAAEVKEHVTPVDTFVAGSDDSAAVVLMSGTLEPQNQSNIAAKVSGICRRVNVEVGDRVKKGQALASLDTSTSALGVEQAEVAVKTAEVAAQAAKNDFDRIVELKKEGSITESDFEKAELGYKSAVNGLDQARVALKLARNSLYDATVRAPYDGQVIMRMVSVGNYMDPMTNPVLFVMVDASRLLMNLRIPEMRAHLVKVGDTVEVTVPAAQRTFRTTIENITDTVDPMAHTRSAVAWVDNTADPIAAGLYFEARITPEALRGKMMIPASSIVERDGKTIVYAVESGHAKAKEITGSWLPDHADYVVESGVATGDVIIRECSMVRDGQPVAATGEGASPAGSASEG